MNTDPLRILILTGSFGEGHNQAANAIREAVEARHPNSEVRVLDFMQWVHPKLDSFVQFCLYKSCQKVPSLYGYLYKATDRVSATNPMNRPLQRVGRSRLLTYLKEFDPAWVVSTFPISANVLSRMKEVEKIPYRTATVITDLHPHSQWIHPFTDQYFVASESVRHILRKRGVSRSRIEVTGIPVRKKFSRPINKSKHLIKQELGIHPYEPMIVVTGGGAGIFPEIEKCLDILTGMLPSLQIVVICGRNESLKDELELLAWNEGWSQVYIRGFVDNIDQYFAAADIVVGKSGGMTTAELLAIGVPMMIYRPLPGQETYNARHLVRSGAALLAMNPYEMVDQLSQLMKSSSLLESLRHQAVSLGRAEAAAHIAEQLVSKSAAQVPSPVKHA